MTEYSLHSEIKNWYRSSGDEIEVKVENYVVDIVRGKLLIEIQTQNFSAIKNKLNKLALNNQVRLVYPIAQLKWIVRVSKSGEFIWRRKSPKKGKIIDLFHELVHAPSLIKDSNFSLEVLLIEEEELRCNDRRGSWRRKGVSIKDKKLLKVFDQRIFENNQDFLKFLPKELDNYFTNKGLAKKMGISLNIAQKMTYCLRKMDAISIADKKKNQLLFQIS